MSLAYQRLRVAQARFGIAPAQLSEPQRFQVEREAVAAAGIESRVLATPEAATVVIEALAVNDAIAAIADRYPSYDEFLDDLKQSGLDVAALHQALHRELTFDATMSRIGAQSPPADEETIRDYYASHRSRFTVLERRRVRHLLITINDDFAENRRERARQRLETIAVELHKGTAFDLLASQYSECPSALQGGLLGEVTAGTLYPELDGELFQMVAGAVSGVIESEVGVHLLYCEAILPERVYSLDEARERIREQLTHQSARQRQRAWLDGLKDGHAEST